MVNSVEPRALSALLEYGPARMRRAAVKLTHVGEQTGPVPTLVISSCYHLPRMDVFRALRSPGISYANDELPEVLQVVVLPETLWQVVAAAAASRSGAQGPAGDASLSVMAYVETDGLSAGGELVLSRGEGADLHRALAGLISPANEPGAAMLRRQRGSTYGEGEMPERGGEKG